MFISVWYQFKNILVLPVKHRPFDDAYGVILFSN